MPMLTRSEWGMPGPLGAKQLTSRGIWLHHSVTRATSDPVADARRIAQIGIQRFGRMSYSWVVHPDGTILEGQAGHLGVHTRGQNATTQAIVCVGNFENDPVTPELLQAVRRLVTDYGPLLGGHRDAPGAATACPGRNLHSRLAELRVPIAPEPAVVETVAPVVEPILEPVVASPVEPVVVAPVVRSPVPDLRDGWVRHLARLRRRY